MPESLVPALTATCVASIVITTVAILLRFYVRIFIQRHFRTDDYLLLFGYASILVVTICMLLQRNHCVGTHTVLVLEHLDQLKNALVLLFVAQLFGVFAIAVIKIAIAMFFFSLRPPQILRLISLCTVVFSTVSTIVMASFLIFQCKPVSYFWERLDFDSPVTGSCLGPRDLYILDSVFNAMDLATDTLLAGLPFLMVRNMKKLSISKKFGVSILLGLCILNIICPLVRCFYLKKTVYDLMDSTYDTAYLIITMIAEPTLALSICCIIQLRPLIHKIFPRAQPPARQIALRNAGLPPTIGQAARSRERRTPETSLLQPTCDIPSTVLSSFKFPHTVDFDKSLHGINVIMSEQESLGLAMSPIRTTNPIFPKRPDKLFTI